MGPTARSGQRSTAVHGSWAGTRHRGHRSPATRSRFDGVLDHDGVRIVSITTDTSDGTYTPGESIVFTATMSESVTSGSSMTLILNNGDTVVVAAATDGTSLTSSGYTAAGYVGTLVVTDVVDGDAGMNPVIGHDR